MRWALATVTGLELAGITGLLDHRPGVEAYEITVRPLFIALFILGAILAWRWEIVDGVLTTFTAAGLLVWHGSQLQPLHASIAVVAFAVPGFAWLLLDLHDQRRPAAILGVVAALLARSGGVRGGLPVLGRPVRCNPPRLLRRAARRNARGLDLGRRCHVALGGDRRQAGRPGQLGCRRRTAGDADPLMVVAGVADGDTVRFEVGGLEPDTEYGIELVERGERPGEGVQEATFRTFPDARADVTTAVGSCKRVGTNGAVFDTIAALEPTMFIQNGDLHDANIGDDDPEEFREVLDVNLSRTGPSNLFRSVPIADVWDDHDYGANNADATSPSRPAALSVYRQYVPSYVTTGPDDPIYQAFDVGDVRVILTDVRSARSPAAQLDDADKTMLGAEQKAWLKAELLAADETHDLTIWVNPVGWIGAATAGGDAWGGYGTERRELANFIADHDIDRLVMLSGDAHMVAIDDGSNTGYADGGQPSFPVLHAGALDRPGHVKGGPYSEGAIPGGGQFGLVEIADSGGSVEVRLSGRDWTGDVLLSYEITFPLE